MSSVLVLSGESSELGMIESWVLRSISAIIEIAGIILLFVSLSSLLVMQITAYPRVDSAPILRAYEWVASYG